MRPNIIKCFWNMCFVGLTMVAVSQSTMKHRVEHKFMHHVCHQNVSVTHESMTLRIIHNADVNKMCDVALVTDDPRDRIMMRLRRKCKTKDMDWFKVYDENDYGEKINAVTDEFTSATGNLVSNGNYLYIEIHYDILVHEDLPIAITDLDDFQARHMELDIAVFREASADGKCEHHVFQHPPKPHHRSRRSGSFVSVNPHEGKIKANQFLGGSHHKKESWRDEEVLEERAGGHFHRETRYEEMQREHMWREVEHGDMVDTKTKSHHCDQTRCISHLLVCDGIRHCDDHGDEQNCAKKEPHYAGEKELHKKHPDWMWVVVSLAILAFVGLLVAGIVYVVCKGQKDDDTEELNEEQTDEEKAGDVDGVTAEKTPIDPVFVVDANEVNPTTDQLYQHGIPPEYLADLPGKEDMEEATEEPATPPPEYQSKPGSVKDLEVV